MCVKIYMHISKKRVQVVESGVIIGCLFLWQQVHDHELHPCMSTLIMLATFVARFVVRAVLRRPAQIRLVGDAVPARLGKWPVLLLLFW